MDEKRETRRWEEGGLVFTVEGAEVSRCPKCGEEAVGVTNIEGMYQAVARYLITARERLSPSEIRFLRKYLGLSGSDFAAHVGVDRATVSRWESGAQAMGPQMDRLLRLLVAHAKPIDEYPIETLKDVATAEPVDRRLRVAASTRGSWEARPS
ncbi:MAG: helix-turn-helix domain-containing protein [Deltaproteobacteria bacterium]|nr:helix-turn-helix domain-containing protein [Deltaproteobacteria bacterium]